MNPMAIVGLAVIIGVLLILVWSSLPTARRRFSGSTLPALE